FWQRKSQIHLLRHLAGIRGEAEKAVAARRETLKLYPSRPRTHVDLADCLVQVGTCDAMIEAQQHLQRALDMDSKRPEGEIIRRFNDRTLAEIASRMERIEALQRDRACISP
ncbi:MAG: hypothetical protein GXP29_07970, partial [Planctomycetes bacterium]|nr:hypothetical protein [Planctomycetota bacterium]